VAAPFLSNIRFVITVALKQEIPLKDLLQLDTVSVLSLKSLKSNNFSSLNPQSTILIILTGVGPENSKEASEWIKNHLTPLAIVNWGTCGAYNTNTPKGTLLLFGEDPPFIADYKKAEHPLISIKEIEPPPSSSFYRDMEFQFQAKILNNVYGMKVVTDHDNKIDEFYETIPNVPSIFKSTFQFLFRSINSNDISVIIPTYNRNLCLRRAIKSCLSQSTLPKEILVVDDGSSDDTQSLIPHLNSPLIKYIKLKSNQGVSTARNIGVMNASGKMVAFLDSDDSWEKDKIAKQIHYINHHPYLFIFQSQDQWVRNNSRKTIPSHLQKKEGWIFKESLERCMISPSSVMIDKSIFKEYQFNETLRVCEDYDLWIRLTRRFPIGLERSDTLCRFAGHHDQLSLTTKLDIARIQSLFEALSREKISPLRKSIYCVLEKKIKIVINGAKKRNVSVDPVVLEIKQKLEKTLI